MKVFWKKHKFFIAIALYIVIVFAVGYLVKIFLIDKIIEKSDKIQEMNIDSQLSRDKISKIPEMENANEEYERNKETLDIVIVPSGEVEFIRNLESLAENTRNKISLEIEDVQDSSKAKAKTTKKKKDEEKGIFDLLTYDKYLKIKVTLEGDYVGLVDFISKLENFKYYVNVVSIDSKKEIVGNSNERNGNIFSPDNSKEEKSLPEYSEIIRTKMEIIAYKEE